ncbi:MAG: AAA family ATPase [Verrucomicrobiae bacterium]|nr:AAA family ATPase [Verrucomicrobiae bacterium]
MKEASTAPEELQGSLERIIYANEENHYTVAELLVESPVHPKKQEGRTGRRTVTITGNLPSVQCGETLKLQGQWVNHPQFGAQFKISRYESVLPSTVNGLKKYLGSGLIKGIGAKFAERIVDHFGKDTLDVIDQYSGRLREVPGIGQERAGRIRLAWLEQKAVRDIMIFLQSYGITTSQAAKIYKIYGEKSMEIVKDNPYRLARDIYGIGFRTADQIARNLGIPSDSAKRIQAGIHHQLESFLGEGHSACPRELLVRAAAADLLGVDEGPVERQILQMIQNEQLRVEPQEDLIYLGGMHHAECRLAERIRDILNAPLTLPPIIMDKALEWAGKQSHIQMSKTQMDAVSAGITSKLTVITGGPGVGKTTIVRSMVKILSYKKVRVALCAPTGRAAKRLSESCSHPAQTIHRLLQYNPSSHSFVHRREQPLPLDFLVVDEASMLDLPLANNLFQAIPDTASVVLVGDVDQLPSVGPGNVLRDIIESRIAPVIFLREIFRQHHQSRIIVNAHRINEGLPPEFTHNAALPGGDPDPEDEWTGNEPPSQPPTQKIAPATGPIQLSTQTDFHFLPVASPEDALRLVVDLCANEIPLRFGFDPRRDIQVMAPMHRGVCGVENLNRELQKKLNPPSAKAGHAADFEIERYGRLFRIGDKVMQTRNNYDKDVFNGDMGRVTAISRENQILTVRIDNTEVDYDFTELDELLPAYAISIHKSQGSEYPVVVIPILTQHFIMLQRNLIYTAITRGRKLVVLAGSAKSLSIAIKNNKTALRHGLLKKRLEGGPGNQAGSR